MPQTHHLQIGPEAYEAVASGRKSFEICRNDRGITEGDVVRLIEYDQDGATEYSGRTLRRTVTYKLPGGQFGIEPDFCVLGLSRD